MRYLGAGNPAFGEDRRTYKVGVNGVTSSQTAFNVSYDGGRVEAYLNGVRLFPDDDYTKTSSGIGTLITLATAIGANNVLEVVGYQGINSGNALVEDNFIVGTNSTGSGGSYGGSTTEFSVASSAGDTVSVWRNGIKLVPTTDFTVQPATSKVTLGSGATANDEITVQVVGGVIHNNGLTVNSGSNSFFLPTTRGTDNYVLTRDDSIGTGGTAWKETLQGPTITAIKYSNQTSGTFVENSGQTATDPAGGDLCLLTGTLFDSTLATPANTNNVGITIDGTSATSISVNSAKTEVTFSPPAKSAGNYTLTATNASGLNATTTIVYDSVPSWTATGALGNFIIGGSFTNSSTPNIRIQASEGSDTITYRQTDSSGSTITTAIAGLTLGTSGANAGYLTGTLGGTDGATHNFYAVATDAELQDTNSAPTLFNIITRAYAGTGGTINSNSWVSGKNIHVFQYTTSSTTDQTFQLFESRSCEILVVGGGGAGGVQYGGGGGAGGLQYVASHTLSAGSYTINVGAGGGAITAINVVSDGDPSVFKSGSTILLKGLGGGGGNNQTQAPSTNMGSGGGAGYSSNTVGTSAQSSGSGSTIGQGFGHSGGAHIAAPDYNPGGGGGAGSAGGTAVATRGGHGGTGKDYSSIFSTNVGDVGWFASGGGGGGSLNGQGTGTSLSGGAGGGGGGAGAGASNNGTNASAHSGGGGGGAGGNGATSGAGGSGIVVIRYAV